MNSKAKSLTMLLILSYVFPVNLLAADPTSGTLNTPNNDAYTTAPSGATTTKTPPLHKTSKHHKKKSSQSTTANPTTPTSGGNTTPPATNDSIKVSGLGNESDIHNPGGPNMGTADHTPGTTGTSGQ